MGPSTQLHTWPRCHRPASAAAACQPSAGNRSLCSGTDSTLKIAGAVIPLMTKANEQLPSDGRLLDVPLLLNYPTSLKRFIDRFDMITAIIKHTKSRLITPSCSHFFVLPLQIQQKYNSFLLQVCAMLSRFLFSFSSLRHCTNINNPNSGVDSYLIFSDLPPV